MMENEFQPGDKVVISAWCAFDLNNHPEYMARNYPLGSFVTIIRQNIQGDYEVNNDAGWWSFPPECLEPVYHTDKYVILTEYHPDDYQNKVVDEVPVGAILKIESEVIIGGTVGLPYYRCHYNDNTVSFYAYQLVPLKISL